MKCNNKKNVILCSNLVSLCIAYSFISLHRGDVTIILNIWHIQASRSNTIEARKYYRNNYNQTIMKLANSPQNQVTSKLTKFEYFFMVPESALKNSLTLYLTPCHENANFISAT